jgi:hypothetical protein
VLSTNLLFHVGGVRGAVKDRLEAAGQRGNASLYITGINPGWINSIATAITAICNRVDCVAIYESADCSSYESPETWNFFRMGQHGVTDEVIEAAKTWLVMFRDAADVEEQVGAEHVDAVLEQPGDLVDVAGEGRVDDDVGPGGDDRVDVARRLDARIRTAAERARVHPLLLGGVGVDAYQLERRIVEDRAHRELADLAGVPLDDAQLFHVTLLKSLVAVWIRLRTAAAKRSTLFGARRKAHAVA